MPGSEFLARGPSLARPSRARHGTAHHARHDRGEDADEPDLVADLFGEVGSGADGEEEEASIGAGEVEEVGGAGEGEEVAVEVGALGEGEEVTGGALADVAADLFGEVGSGADGEEEEADVGAGEVEEVGGACEGEEVAVEVGALGEGEEVTGGALANLAADLFGEVDSGADGEEEEAGVGAGEVEEVGGAGKGEEVAVGELGEGEEVTGGALVDAVTLGEVVPCRAHKKNFWAMPGTARLIMDHARHDQIHFLARWAWAMLCQARPSTHLYLTH